MSRWYGRGRGRGWFGEPLAARRARPVAGGGIGASAYGGGGRWLEGALARRWIEVLESFGQSGRLVRGRSYARRGQVVSIGVEAGGIEAQVQGSRPRPYRVQIALRAHPVAKWRAALRALARRPELAAQLLAGAASPELEAALARAGVPLLPAHARELATRCSCPDWGDPCKHVAAVHYVFAAELDRDPLLLLQLRGLAKETLQAALALEEPDAAPSAKARAPRRSGAAARRQQRAVARQPAAPIDASTEAIASAASEPAAPLSCNAATFLRGGELPALALAELAVPARPAAELAPLGSLRFWKGDEPLLELLAPLYQRASIAAAARCVEVLLCEGGAGASRPA